MSLPARGAKNAVDAVFAEPSFAGSTAVRHLATPGEGLGLSDLDLDLDTLRWSLNL
jgi:hypothetical protein